MEGKLNCVINVDSTEAIKKLNKATKAAERFGKALDNLKQIDITLNIEQKKLDSKKWYQFWK